MGAAGGGIRFYCGYQTLEGHCSARCWGRAPDADLVRSIREKVLSYEGVIGVHDMLVHNYGPNSLAGLVAR